MYPQVANFIAERMDEFDQIPPARKHELEALAKFVSARRDAGDAADLTFICTHNSRRSHLAQLWAAVAAAQHGLKHVTTYSGGTEATAFNPRAVAALERLGFEIEKGPEADNPRYQVRFAEDQDPLVCFSKVYSSPPNPSSDYCAVMVCGHADESCPTVTGATLRIAITYEDPKVADDTPAEAERYDERCAQIAREMLYAFAQVD